jgi:predicted phage baseplate assembly protein
VSLPDVLLDDVRFQDLVNESRARIGEKCEEWTEVNVSDPGITLVELFAWMTEMLSYRINRLPEKLHVALLSLLGVKLLPPLAATAEVCFRLEAPPETAVAIARDTEVATRRTSTQESVVFQTTVGFAIQPVRLQACWFRRSFRDGGVDEIEVRPSGGRALPVGRDRLAFGSPPRPGDYLLLGFTQPLDRLLMRVDVECAPARWTGVVPRDPPLVWEVWTATQRPDTADAEEEPTAGEWTAVARISDSTKAFNKTQGSIELQMPPRTAAVEIHERRLYLLRCMVFEAVDERSNPPQILALTAAPVGATIPVEHSQAVTTEQLGHSDGTPGETFALHRAPILTPAADERLEVRQPNASQWMAWERVQTFADSSRHDRHYMLDETAGEIQLGPAVRSHDGGFRQFGVLTTPRSELRFSKYRHGGGSAGNVAAGTLTHLRQPIPRVSSVTNMRAARGGADGETLADAGRRTAIDLRTRERAITREDFETLCVSAHERVARAHCIPGDSGEATCVHILPRVDTPADRLEPAELVPDDELLQRVARHLDERRLVGTTIVVKPARCRVVTVVARALASRTTDAADLERRILEALYQYLNPLVGGSASASAGGPAGAGALGPVKAAPAGSTRAEHGGWQFGRALTHGELFPLVQGVDGVSAVRFMRVYAESGKHDTSALVEVDGALELDEDEVIASGSHRVKVDVPGV